jgi:hypothetical protein
MSEQISVYVSLVWEHLLLADTRLTSDIDKESRQQRDGPNLSSHTT